MLWAAMESQAFICQEIEQLIDVGLSVIPAESQIAQLVGDIRRWRREDNDWQTTRQRIDDNYGYHKYPSNCHIIPNHALMIMAILYAPDDFQQAQCIVNTSGWDTDCNAGECRLSVRALYWDSRVLTQARTGAGRWRTEC